jgi:hypothetical protein
MATTGNGKIETYMWICGDLDCKTIDCFKANDLSQTVCGLWEAKEVTDFHDDELVQATKKINAIVSRIEKGNKNKKRNLSFLHFRNRLFLIWAEYGVVGPDDDDKTIMKALKLQSPARPKRAA